MSLTRGDMWHEVGPGEKEIERERNTKVSEQERELKLWSMGKVCPVNCRQLLATTDALWAVVIAMRIHNLCPATPLCSTTCAGKPHKCSINRISQR